MSNDDKHGWDEYAITRRQVLQGAVIGEPTDLDVVVAHKGAVRWRTTVHGKAAHTSRPDLGVNAISMTARLIDRILKGIDAGEIGTPEMLVVTSRDPGAPPLRRRADGQYPDVAPLRGGTDALQAGQLRVGPRPLLELSRQRLVGQVVVTKRAIECVLRHVGISPCLAPLSVWFTRAEDRGPQPPSLSSVAISRPQMASSFCCWPSLARPPSSSKAS